MDILRKDWLRALATQPKKNIQAVLAGITANWTVSPVQLPQTGLAMLQLCDSAFNDPYFLGEIPLATAWMEVTTGQGEHFQGAAQLMDDDQEKIEMLAVCDAVLAHRLPGWQTLDGLVKTGMTELVQEQNLRNAMLAKTRVDFALLNTSAEDGDD